MLGLRDLTCYLRHELHIVAKEVLRDRCGRSAVHPHAAIRGPQGPLQVEQVLMQMIFWLRVRDVLHAVQLCAVS